MKLKLYALASRFIMPSLCMPLNRAIVAECHHVARSVPESADIAFAFANLPPPRVQS